MKSAREWRQEYVYRRGKAITPRSLIDDILADMETVEAENRDLRLDLKQREDLNSDLEQDITELEEEVACLEKRAKPVANTPAIDRNAHDPE